MVMTKSVFILLQLLFVATAVLAKSSSGLIYVGNFDENDYFVSPNSASWQSADNDCRNQLGGHGHLLAIETQAEWDFLIIALENFGFGTTYWTSGMYDPARAFWRWTKNDNQLGAFAPWGPGYPSVPNQLLRVSVYFTNRYDNHWRTIPGTQLHRYICESLN